MATVDDVKGWNPYMLAWMAGCASPDHIAENGGDDSAGAAMLRSVLADVVERVEWAREQDGVTWSNLRDHMADAVAEIADAAPNVYTFPRWQEFVDLAAWQEDLTELGGGIDAEDVTTSVAGVALYMIAERLAVSIVEELAEQDEDEEDGEE